MEILKINAAILKNIRIRTQSRSNSKSKRSQKNIKLQKIANNQNLTQCLNSNEQPINILAMFLKKQNSIEKSKNTSIFFENRETKNGLNLNKQNRLKIVKNKIVKNKTVKLQNENLKYYKLGKKPMPVQQETQIMTSQSNGCKTKRSFKYLQNNSPFNKANKQNFITLSQIDLSESINKNKQKCVDECKKNFNSRIRILTISQQVCLKIKAKISRKNCEVQVSQNSYYDKCFAEYMKHRQVKLNNFNQMSEKYSKMSQAIKQTENFKQNYKQLMNYVSEPTLNQRQKRVFGLSKDLESQENKLKQSFDNLMDLSNQLQDNLNKKKINYKKNQLFLSIEHLINASILEINKIQGNNKRKAKRILQRSLKQLNYLQQLTLGTESFEKNILERYQQSIKKFSAIRSQWSIMHYQNRVLLYNFMKQIQRIPAISIALFGFKKEEVSGSLDWNTQFQNNFDEYMTAKCQQCYHLKKKINFLQFTNTQIKPIFKSLQWLIRDCSKEKPILSLL